MALRTTYLDVEQTDLIKQVELALRDRATVLVYGSPRRSIRIARALIAAEQRIGKPIRCTREHDRWVLAR